MSDVQDADGKARLKAHLTLTQRSNGFDDLIRDFTARDVSTLFDFYSTLLCDFFHPA